MQLYIYSFLHTKFILVLAVRSKEYLCVFFHVIDVVIFRGILLHLGHGKAVSLVLLDS